MGPVTTQDRTGTSRSVPDHVAFPTCPGGPLTQVAHLPRWPTYPGGPLTQVAHLPRWPTYPGGSASRSAFSRASIRSPHVPSLTLRLDQSIRTAARTSCAGSRICTRPKEAALVRDDGSSDCLAHDTGPSGTRAYSLTHTSTRRLRLRPSGVSLHTTGATGP